MNDGSGHKIGADKALLCLAVGKAVWRKDSWTIVWKFGTIPLAMESSPFFTS